MVDLARLDTEIRDGLSSATRKRLLDYEHQIGIYRGDFARYGASRDISRPLQYNDHRNDRSLLLMHRIVDSLTSNLYKVPPSRALQGYPSATEYLDHVYTQNRANALWQAADKLTHAADYCAFQVVGTDDPTRPIKIHLWQSSNFVAYTSATDPLVVEAVLTIDEIEGQRKRYRLYTDEYVVTYQAEEPLPGRVTAAATPVRVKSEPNPYGVLPFSFAHYNVPTIDFLSGGIGAILTEVNEHVNYRLSSLADALKYSRPIAALEGVDATYVPPRWLAPGDWLKLPGGRVDARGDIIKPGLNFTAPPLDFVTKELDDLNQYIDLTLQTVGVPPAAIRLVQSSVKSGAAIVAEQIPLMLYARSRQAPWTYYEEDLCRLVLRVSIAHFRAAGVATGFLEEALNDFHLLLRWGDVFPDMPGPDRDKADQWLLDHGMTSPVMLLMRRNDLTREEAEEFLEQVQKDMAQVAPPEPTTTAIADAEIDGKDAETNDEKEGY